MLLGVMYSDQTIMWVEFADLGALPTSGVLFIAITTERGNRKALVTRLWDRFNGTEGAGWSGSDNYAIGVDAVEDRFFVDQWNDRLDSLRVRSLTDPHGKPTVTRRHVQTFPPGYDVHTFEGKAVNDTEWSAALARFELEMY